MVFLTPSRKVALAAARWGWSRRQELQALAATALDTAQASRRGDADDRLATVQLRMRMLTDPDLRPHAHRIRVQVEQGVSTVRGRVPADVEIRLLDLAVDVAGKGRVRNELRVAGGPGEP